MREHLRHTLYRFSVILALAIAASPCWAISDQFGGISDLSVGQSGEGPVTPAGTFGPCDILSGAGTPCVAAHSVTRQMWSVYNGPLFQLIRASDLKTQNIGFTTAGIVDQATINRFCIATTCAYSLIYDNIKTNNLPQATGANEAPLAYTNFANGTKLPMVQTGAQQFYRNRTSTIGIPTGNSATTEYDVISTINYSFCCGTYGNMETTATDNGSGHMFALGFGTGTPQAGTGTGPWTAIDFENGFYTYGATVNNSNPLLTTIIKYNPTGTTWTIKNDPGVSGTLTTTANTVTAPNAAAFEGGISLGEGGDTTPAPTAFFEGVITASLTVTATDNSLAKNIAGFYNSAPTSPKNFFVNDIGIMNNVASPGTLHPSSPTPANGLLIAFGFDISLAHQTSGAITDTQGNTWTLAGSVGFGPNTGVVTFFYCWNCKALATTDTITYTDANAVDLEEDFAYITNVQFASNPFDSVASATTTTGSVTSGTPAVNGEIFVGLNSCGTTATLQSNGFMTPPFVFKPNAGLQIVAGVFVDPAQNTVTYNANGSSCTVAMIMPFKHN